MIPFQLHVIAATSTKPRSMSLPTASLWRETAALSRSENSLKLAAEDVGRFGKLVILPIPAGFFEKL
jgi:hypothetical protein